MIAGGLGAMIGASMAVGVMFVFGFLSIGLVALLTVLALALMIMAFVGAYCTFRKRCFALALAGAICSAMSIPFLAGVLATVFLALRESEFDGRGAKERFP
ncbi:MAG: hypothetical protein R6V51_01760 [Dehalococcoidia bacterium]